MRTDNYSGALTREQFLFAEMRTTALLVTEGLSDAEITQRIYSENLFQYPTEKSLRSKARTCLKRIKALGNSDLTEQLARGSFDVAKQIVLYAIMCGNAIVWDFMTDVVGEKFRTGQMELSRMDVNIFIEQLQNRVVETANWSDSTVAKIKQVLTKLLVECEYLESPRSTKLEPVYLYPELERGIREKGDIDALPAFNCF